MNVGVKSDLDSIYNDIINNIYFKKFFYFYLLI